MAARKKFQQIEIPILDETIQVLGTPESLDKKTIKLDLTRKLKGKSLEIILKIFNNEALIAHPKKLHLMKFYVKRMMRKRASYVEDSFQAQCKDIRATIKPFLITRKKVSRAIKNHLRKEARNILLNYLKEKEYFNVCSEILSGEVQKALLPKLKKIYPLSLCEIRVFETKELEKAELPGLAKKSKETPSKKTKKKKEVKETKEKND